MRRQAESIGYPYHETDTKFTSKQVRESTSAYGGSASRGAGGRGAYAGGGVAVPPPSHANDSDDDELNEMLDVAERGVFGGPQAERK